MIESDVYLHRSSDGYAFVSFDGPEPADVPLDECDPPLEMSGIEWVESRVLAQPWADDWLGPYSPSDLDFLDDGEYEDSGHLPTEAERGDVDYKVGKMVVSEGGLIHDLHIHYPEVIYHR